MEGPIQILIASDYPVMRAGLRSILDRAEGCAVAGESTLQEAPAQLSVLAPDVVLLDAPGGDRDEIDLLSRLISEMPGVGILLLSGDASETAAREALQAGVRGYLFRDASPEEIASAVRSVAQGLSVLQPQIARALAAGPGPRPPAAEEPLTAREMEVLQLMAQGLPSKTIAARLGISEHTVKFHVGSILGKLGAASRTEAVTVAIRRGLLAV